MHRLMTIARTLLGLAAARTRRGSVIMIARPDPEPGPATPSVETARDWVLSRG